MRQVIDMQVRREIKAALDRGLIVNPENVCPKCYMAKGHREGRNNALCENCHTEAVRVGVQEGR